MRRILPLFTLAALIASRAIACDIDTDDPELLETLHERGYHLSIVGKSDVGLTRLGFKTDFGSVLIIDTDGEGAFTCVIQSATGEHT